MVDVPRQFVRGLVRIVGNSNVLDQPADRWAYGYDNSRKHHPPDVVAFATEHKQVLAIVRLCNEHAIPLTARGRGTNTAGGTVPRHGGLVLSLERMNQIIGLDPANRIMRVEPGITNQAVQEAAANHGLFWPPDPTSAEYCTVGGNLAMNAAGPRALKYGGTRENVLGLRAVTGDGREIHAGVMTTKGVVGYDLTRLIIGSEGTLAIATEAVLKLTPLPESRRTLQAVYTNIHDAATAVSRLMRQPITPCVLEFMDAEAIRIVRDYTELQIPPEARAALIIEVDGPDSAMEAAVAAVRTAAGNQGLLEFIAAGTDAQEQGLWKMRKTLSPALRSIAPNKLNEDVVVPVSRIPDLIEGLEKLSREFAIPIVNFGHAGNGNIHVNLLYDTQDPIQEKNALPCLGRVFDLVLDLKGTLSGEHGIGFEKSGFIAREIDPVTLDLMWRIKQQFDPRCILNPEKIFPSQYYSTPE